eukprot:gene13163-biopygen6101
MASIPTARAPQKLGRPRQDGTDKKLGRPRQDGADKKLAGVWDRSGFSLAFRHLFHRFRPFPSDPLQFFLAFRPSQFFYRFRLSQFFIGSVTVRGAGRRRAAAALGAFRARAAAAHVRPGPQGKHARCVILQACQDRVPPSPAAAAAAAGVGGGGGRPPGDVAV